VLDISKIEAEHLELDESDFELAAIIDHQTPLIDE
jgi:hypothetical protein